MEEEIRDLLISSPDMNVKIFDAVGVLDLVKQRVQPASRCILSEETKHWISGFWDTYRRLPSPPAPTSLDPLPLIPTTNGDYISLEYCRRDDVISEPRDERGALVSAMQRMDLVFCQIPEPLRASFDKPFNLGSFLRAIQLKSDPFQSLSSDETREVCHWIRSQVYGCIDKGSRNIIRKLAIWPAKKNNRVVLLDTHSLEMLPDGVSVDIFDGYVKPGNAIANFSRALHTALSWPPVRQTLTSDTLAQLLTFPVVLHPANEDSYVTLLQAFLDLGGAGKIPVPDGNLRVRQVDELYDHSVQLFSDALQSSERSVFLHRSFRHMNQQLRLKGLRFKVDVSSPRLLLCQGPRSFSSPTFLVCPVS